MPHHTPSRRRAWTAAAVLTLLAGLAAVIWLRPDPPTPAFEQAREALAQARRAEAATYAAESFARAEHAWQAALAAWQHENARWFLLRDYAQAAAAAADAAREADDAAARAQNVRDSLYAVAAAGLPFLRQQTAALKQQLDGLPHNRARHAALSTAESLLAEAERALDRKDYWTAAHNVQQAATRADFVNDGLSELLRGYLADLPAWKQWRDETVAWSARHKAPAIVVDKMAQRCYLYVAGRLQATYPVELGPQWIGDKSHEGDLATPEGRYHVVRKLDAGQTIYHRALLINYPNDADRKRFAEAKRRGALPADARIGGLIELHGQGGRGANWTKGCVALSNPDMEALFRVARVGTPVTIVGALEAPRFAGGLEPVVQTAMPLPAR